MTRRNELENYVIGSCLTNREYVKEVVIIPPDIITNPLSRQILMMLPQLTSDMPLEDITDNADDYGYDLVAHACYLSTFNFDARKFEYNNMARINFMLDRDGQRPTHVLFRDYVSQYLKYTYALQSGTST